jgi:hypothetical protein
MWVDFIKERVISVAIQEKDFLPLQKDGHDNNVVQTKQCHNKQQQQKQRMDTTDHDVELLEIQHRQIIDNDVPATTRGWRCPPANANFQQQR